MSQYLSIYSPFNGTRLRSGRASCHRPHHIRPHHIRPHHIRPHSVKTGVHRQLPQAKGHRPRRNSCHERHEKDSLFRKRPRVEPNASSTRASLPLYCSSLTSLDSQCEREPPRSTHLSSNRTQISCWPSCPCSPTKATGTPTWGTAVPRGGSPMGGSEPA